MAGRGWNAGRSGIETEKSNLKWGPPSKPPSSSLEDLSALQGPQRQARETHLLPPASCASNTVPGSGEGREVGCPRAPLAFPQSLMPLPPQHKSLKSWSPHSFILPCGLQRKGNTSVIGRSVFLSLDQAVLRLAGC